MSLEANKAVVRRAYEVGMNKKDWAVIDEVFSPDYVVHYPGVPAIHGLEDAKQALKAFLDAFPDIHFVVEDQLAEGDKVTTRWSGKGTHSGEYRGFPVSSKVYPPTGKPVQFSATDIYLIKDGKIVEEWNTLETLVVLHQIGVVPDPE
ncbi:MAG: ester cyclase [Candidatus Competibacteraceae bacterium]